jgi:hypothetical protein
MRLSFGTHDRAATGVSKDEWLTPPEIIAALGPFDLDPCSPAVRPWPTATRHLTADDDGLASAWETDEFVWCNPPYGQQTWTWLDKLADHPAGGIGLVFARTCTKGFFDSAWNRADAALFLRGRLRFHHRDGRRATVNAGAPNVLLAYGPTAVERLEHCGIAGVLIRDWALVGAGVPDES